MNNPSAALDRSWSFIFDVFLPVMIISNVLISVDRQKMLMFWLVVTGGVIAHHSIGQYFSPDHIGWTGLEAIWRGDKDIWQIIWFGTLGDPNDLGQFFLILIPFILFLFSQTSSWFIKFIVLNNLGLIMCGIYITNSRGTLLGILSMAGLWFLLKYGAVKSAIAVFTVSPAFALLTRNTGAIDSQDESANARLDAWVQGYFMVRDNPLFGVGLRGFLENHYKTAHNSYVLAYAETGMLGYFFWTFMLFACGMWAHKLSSGQSFSYVNNSLYEKIETERRLAGALMYSLVGSLVSAFFLSRSYSLTIFIVVALIMSQIVRFERLIPGYKHTFKWHLFAPITVASVIIITVTSFKMR